MPHGNIFKDRKEGGRELAMLLQEFKDTNSIVLALPRGGVITGKEVAKSLDLPLDVIVTRKVGAPMNEEYAIGAIDLDGESVFNEEELSVVDKVWLEKEKYKEQQEAKRRWTLYRGERGPLDLTGKTAIIVDDGIATGMTMKVAIRYAKKLGASRVVVAVPVAPFDVVDELKKEADVRVLKTPESFFAVGEYYEDFPQVEDEEVVRTLKD